MGYKAKIRFADLEDGKRLYLAGEDYPRDGLIVSEQRLLSLSGSDNLSGRPLIEYVPDEPTEQNEKPKEVSSRKRVKKNA